MRHSRVLWAVSWCVVLAVPGTSAWAEHAYNGSYTEENLDHVAFPLGGIGAGMICLEGAGMLSHYSLHNHPDVFREEKVFAAVCVKGDQNVARVLEGPIPKWKVFALHPRAGQYDGPGNGLGSTTYGLPRFREASFASRFPFATVALADPKMPLKVEVTGWSPFAPPDADSASLPVAALEYRFVNTSGGKIEAVYSFNAANFMAAQGNPPLIRTIEGGFVLAQPPGGTLKKHDEGYFAAFVDEPGTKVNAAWFRGGWFDPLTMAWKDIEEGNCYSRDFPQKDGPSPGATLFVPFELDAGQTKTIALKLCWYVPHSSLRVGGGEAGEGADQMYQPWYAGQFADIDALVRHWRRDYETLRAASRRFSDCFYATTLPAEVVEAVAANLTILKSPTVLRQIDGRFWAFEGCHDKSGCCHGSCTHVWNYAQAMPHLFPSLERTLRETEFCVCQDDKGHQNFRAPLPIREPAHDFHAASDGQLGCVMKVYRDWRISGDTAWMKKLWPQVRQSLNYCIATWDPEAEGIVREPHHNTYDIEFWGPDGMCSSFYLGALQAAAAMGREVGDDDVGYYEELLAKGRQFVNEKLFDGEYFYQQVQTEGLRAGSPLEVQSFNRNYTPEALDLLKKEGPKYQYGTGCLSDGVLGSWMAAVCGLPEALDQAKVDGHLRSVHKYNLKKDLSEHANPQRPGYAVGDDGGLLICTWPKGGMPSLPFVYSNEVWTGIEYQVASHLVLRGMLDEGREIVRVARDRYDGRARNPFNEYECGHWYARAMSSYALLGAYSGARYDAVDRVLHLRPPVRGDFKAFLSTATGYGHVGVKDGKPFCNVVSGRIPFQKIEYAAP
ncbi:MAG TPA: GH116 family glycosyl hydrolase [Sedimentisphaerales bacterium]|jgi:uncharacterized protein (DUF608 family)|nr:GH116 family glycosyl hydrolase [Sedimentisphaerales bacterium]HNU30164.1 GH116 family glycosyl hydrolase [Sedimentisphaerales bacterium]